MSCGKALVAGPLPAEYGGSQASLEGSAKHCSIDLVVFVMPPRDATDEFFYQMGSHLGITFGIDLDELVAGHRRASLWHLRLAAASWPFPAVLPSAYAKGPTAFAGQVAGEFFATPWNYAVQLSLAAPAGSRRRSRARRACRLLRNTIDACAHGGCGQGPG